MFSPSVVDRVQFFVSKNERAVIIGTALVAIGGIAYYASTLRGIGDDVDKGERKRVKKIGGAKPSETAKNNDGPIFEEKIPEKGMEGSLYCSYLVLNNF